MAQRFAIAEFAAPFFVVTLVLTGFLPILGFLRETSAAPFLDSYIWNVLRFTLVQATLSTLLSVIPAIFLARALTRRNFLGKNLSLALLALPLSLPAIIVVLSLVSMFGNSSAFASWFQLYGLNGILLAHVFFNLPLAARLLMSALQTSPPEYHRLGAQLAFTDWQTFGIIDWPVIKSAIGRISALIFLLCVSSFVIILTLGGGPAATTLEVAIYQSLRLDFDLARAATFALFQITVCSLLVFLVGTTANLPQISLLRLNSIRFDGASAASKLADVASLAIAALLVLPVLISILVSGISNIEPTRLLLKALITSLAIGSLSAMLCVSLSFFLTSTMVHRKQFASSLTVVSLLGLIVPPAVVATGWFILTRSWSSGFALSAGLMILLNTLMALPFATSTLTPSVTQSLISNNRLCLALGITGWNRLRHIDIPALRTALLSALVMAFVLSLGDLTAVTLLGSEGIVTLPALIAQQMGNYRGAAAGGTALILATLCCGLAYLAQHLGSEE